VNDKLPSSKTALNILYESGCSKKVIAHCIAVSALSVNFAKECEKKGLNVEINLVEIGALLHDIGRSKSHNVKHAIIGGQIAKSLNLPKSIVSIIECHIGGGISSDEAKRLGLPIRDYFPVTLEEKIVTYADKLIEKAKVVPIENTIDKFSTELGADHPAIDRIIKLHEELSPLVGDVNANNNNS